MHHSIRQHLIITCAISLGLMTALLSLFQPIPSASAQQLTGPVIQGTSGTGAQKKDAQPSTRKPHRLLRKSQSAFTATLQPIPLDASKSTTSTAVPTSTLNDTTTQPKDTSVSSKIGAVTAPAITPLGLMSTAAATTSTTVTPNTTAPHSLLSGATAKAGAATPSASTGVSTPPAGRSMSRLASEMPGLAQLLNPASPSPPPPPAPVPPAIGASPTSLSFAATQGGANPANQTVSISNTGGGTLSWSASDNAAWLSLSPASGTGNATVTLTAATGTLTAGSYSGLVTLSATGATPVTVPVAFTVAAAPVPPAIGASPTSLSFAATQGGANPANQTVSISNTCGAMLSSDPSDNAAWLTLSPASGTGNATVTLTAATGTLTTGSYSGVITLTATGATPVTVPVAFTVAAAPVPPAIGASPTSLSFAATQGGANPANQTVSISNTGGGTLSWSASDNAAWLSLSPASGTGNATVTLTAATGTLTAGSYSGLVTLSATGATPVTVPVAFTVAAAPVPPAIGASPTSLSFAATQGGANPANQTVSITGGGTLSWSASDNAAWLTLSPALGTGNGTVTLTAATGTLTTGSYSGLITLSATGAANVTVPVTFTVAAAPVPPAIGASPTSLSFAATQGGANPANQTVSISNTGVGTLSWSASDNAAWLTLTPASGTGNATV